MLYFWLRDEGSALGGLLALGAGLLAYRAGLKQARATRDVAEAQRREFAERARQNEARARRNLAHQLEAEAWRIKAAAEFRREDVAKRSGGDARHQIGVALREPYKILPRRVLLDANDAPSLFEPETCDALVALLTAVDEVNMRLEILTQVADFHADEFTAHLKTIIACADRCASKLAGERRRS